MMSHDVWLEHDYQERENRSISFEEFCEACYEETDESIGYKEWVFGHYEELKDEWKNM